jgi:hypothetical protein
VTSLAEESLLWEPAPDLPPLQWNAADLMPLIVEAATNVSQRSAGAGDRSAPRERSEKLTSEQYNIPDSEGEQVDESGLSALSRQVHRYAQENREKLQLGPGPIQPAGVHPVFRVAPSGRLVIELIAQVAQQRKEVDAEFGGIPARGGTTLIVGFDGVVKYVVAKPLPDGMPDGPARDEALARLARQRDFVEALDRADPAFAYLTGKEEGERSRVRATLRALHSRR